MKEALNRICDFFTTYDFATIIEASQKLKWIQVLKSPYTWLIVMPILIFLLWTKKFKAIISITSLILFVLLIQRTISHGTQTLAVHDLLVFLSGAVALIGLNIYMFFVRG